MNQASQYRSLGGDAISSVELCNRWRLGHANDDFFFLFLLNSVTVTVLCCCATTTRNLGSSSSTKPVSGTRPPSAPAAASRESRRVELQESASEKVTVSVRLTETPAAAAQRDIHVMMRVRQTDADGSE